jgi:uroporphyrinogen-III synthase
LRRDGHVVLMQPLLRIVFAAPPTDVPTPGGLLVTSQNGLRALARWPQGERWRDVPLFAAGPATARAAEEIGFTDVRGGASDAGSLVEIVTAARPRGPLIYPAAHDRAGGLATGVAMAGHDVRVIEAYTAETAQALDPRVRDALLARTLEGVLLYSRRTAMAFRDLVDVAGLHPAALTAYVISEQVADVVRHLPVRIAARPDEDALLALIPPVGRGAV